MDSVIKSDLTPVVNELSNADITLAVTNSTYLQMQFSGPWISSSVTSGTSRPRFDRNSSRAVIWNKDLAPPTNSNHFHIQVYYICSRETEQSDFVNKSWSSG